MRFERNDQNGVPVIRKKGGAAAKPGHVSIWSPTKRLAHHTNKSDRASGDDPLQRGI
jgi:hypothetical protein